MNRAMRLVRLWVSLGAALVLSAVIVSCAHQKTYVPPNLDDEKTAILEARLPIWITSVDGEKVPSLSLYDSTSIRLLPGTHTVEVALQQFGSRQVMERGVLRLEHSRTYGDRPVELKMLATAGCRYVINYKLTEDEKSKRKIWNVWIVKLESA